MRIVSPFLKRVLYPSLSSAGVFRRIPAAGLAVITYHGVVPARYRPVGRSGEDGLDGNLVSADALRRQIRLLKSHYTVVTPEDVLAWREGALALPQRAVLLTCDDGLLNNLTEMLPVLREEDVKCLFFVTGASASYERKMLWYEELFLLLRDAPAGRFEISCEDGVIADDLQSPPQRRAVWWSLVKRLSQLAPGMRDSFLRGLRQYYRLESQRYVGPENSASCQRFGLMTSRELRELVSAGMTVGAHTLNHPMLSQAPAYVAQAEIAESKTLLESATGKPVWAFAYPFGDAQSVTAQVLEMPQAAGYQAAFLNFGGGLGVGLPPFALPRIHVTSQMCLAEFEAHTSGFYMQLQHSTGRAV